MPSEVMNPLLFSGSEKRSFFWERRCVFVDKDDTSGLTTETIQENRELDEKKKKTEVQFLLKKSSKTELETREEDILRNAKRDGILRDEIDTYFEKKQQRNKEQVFELIQRKDVNPKSYVDTLLGTPAKGVVQEANEKWTGNERRSPMRRYFDWIWELSQQDDPPEGIESFIRNHIGRHLKKYISDEQTNKRVDALVLWEQTRKVEETPDITEQEGSDVLSFSKGQEEKKQKEASQVKEVFSLLSQKKTLLNEDWDLIMKVPIKKLLSSFSEKDSRTFFALFSHPPRSKKSAAQKYLQNELTPDILDEISLKFGKDVFRISREALEISQRSEITNTTESAEEVAHDNRMSWGIAAEEKRKNEFTSLDDDQRNRDSHRVKDEMQEMIRIIKKAGLSDEVLKSAENAHREQRKELMGMQSLDEKKYAERKQAIYLEIQKEIQESIHNGIEMGARSFLEDVLPRLRRQVEVFSQVFHPEIKKAWLESYSGNENSEKIGEDAETLFVKTIELSLHRAEILCGYILEHKSGREILDALHDQDLSDVHDEQGAENSRKVITALIEYSNTIDNEARSVKTDYEENREYLQQELRPYLEMHEDERFDAIIGEIREIADQANVEGKEIIEALSHGDTPEIYSYTVIHAWAEKHNIPLRKASEIIQTLAPASEIIFMGEESFLKKALEAYGVSPQERESLLVWYEQHPESFARQFVDSNGNLEKSLLKIIENELLGVSSYVTGTAADYYQSKGVSREVLRDKKDESEEVLQKIIQPLIPEIQKAEEIAHRLDHLLKNTEIKKNPDLFENIHRTHRLFSDVSHLSQSQNGDIDTLNHMDYFHVLQSLEETLGIEKKFSEGNSPHEVSSALKDALRVAEEKISAIEKMDMSDIEQFPPAVLPQCESLAGTYFEQIDVIEDEQKVNLQKFADWITSKQPLTDEIMETIASLTNANGKAVLQKMSDTEFEKQHGKEEKAIVLIKNGSFEIHVREQDWDAKDDDLEISLRHEGFHTLDAANEKKFSKELFHRLKTEYPQWKEFREMFCKTAGIADNRKFPDELFAYLMAGDHEEMQKILWQGPQELFREFLADEKLQSYSDAFAEKTVHAGFFQKKYARHDIPGHKVDVFFSPQIKKNQQDEIQIQIDRLGKSLTSIRESQVPATGKQEFLQNIEDNLSGIIDRLASPLTDEEYEKGIMELLKELNKNADNALIAIAEAQQPEFGIFQELWNNTTFLSLADLGSIWETGTEYIKRRHQRNSKLRTGKVGKSIFDKLVPNLANEYDNKAEEAEAEEVSNYEKGLDNKDGWQVMDRVGETRNQDELKACLNVLSKRGQIDWYDKRIWRALERVGSGVKILDSDGDDLNTLKIKLQRACAVLYDNDYFRETDRTNSSSFQSEKQKYEGDLSTNVANMGGVIESMLAQKRRGENVDPQRFEAFVEGCIQQGKSNPESVFWYMLQGVHHGILSMDRINYLDSQHLNIYPSLDWFYFKKPRLEEVRSIAERFPPDHITGTYPPSFIDWYMVTIMADKGVRQRTLKSASEKQKSWDHDWSTTVFAVGDVNSAKQMLKKGFSGDTAMPLTAYPNMTNGQLTYITSLARNTDRYSEKDLQSEVSRHLSFTATYNTIVSGNVTNESYHKLNKYELDNPSRITSENLYMSDDALTTREMIERGNRIIRALDPEVFDFIGQDLNDPAKIPPIIQKIENRYGYIKGFSDASITDGFQLLDALPYVIDKVLSGKSKTGLNNVLLEAQQIFAQDHKKPGAQNRFIDESRGIDWRTYSKESLGDAPEEAGMYR